MKTITLAILVCLAGSCEISDAQDCANGRCQVLKAVVATPIVMASHAVHATSDAYQQALASAQYRAANRIKGHCSLDSHTTSGVGWSSNSTMPNTCLGIGGHGYAVVQGVDGFYATKISTTTTMSVTTSHRVRLFRRR
jgi:hypothetical protein